MIDRMAETGIAEDGFVVWTHREPDETVAIDVSGHRVVAYSYGTGEEVLFLLNGGPGLPCDYLRDPHLPLVDHGYRIVVHDQLGTGASDHPDDPSLWTLERYVEEVEAVLAALGLDRVHFLGHSWGGWCGIEYAVRHPGRIRSMILANTAADIPHLMGEIEGLRNALGPQTVAMMQRFEAEGRTDHPAYAAAVDLLDHRHIRRTRARPAPVQRSKDGFNYPIFLAIQGPNEYHYTGSIRSFSRLAEMAAFDWPTLVVGGQHDALTPACARLMHAAVPGSRIRIFPASSHSPFYEEPREYRRTLIDFLDDVRDGA
jgi:proline iminopeptidase